MIRETTSDDAGALLELAKAIQFNADELEVVSETLFGYLSGSSQDLWFTAVENKPVGVIYCTPEPMTQGTWNVLMLLVHPDHQRQGHGSALMSHVEQALEMRGARLIVVETSSLDEFNRARSFYAKCGYTQEARIRNFYTRGDDKIVFSKELA